MPLLGAGLANIKSGGKRNAYVDENNLINWDNSIALPKEWIEITGNRGSFKAGGNSSTNKTTITSPFPVSALIGTDFTTSCWVKIIEMPTAELCIMNLRHTNGEGVAFIVEANTGILTCKYKDASSDKTISSAINIVDNEWHHIAFSHDNSGNYQRLYIDGYSIGTASNTMNFTETNGTLTIGSSNPAGTTYANSFIKLLAFWERVLPEESIRAIMYEADNANWGDLFSGDESTNLICYFPLEENANCLINASYNGTVQNSNAGADFVYYERPHKPRLQSIPIEGKEPTYAFLNTGRAVVFDGVMDHFTAMPTFSRFSTDAEPVKRRTNTHMDFTFCAYIYFDDFDRQYGLMQYGHFGIDILNSREIRFYSKSHSSWQTTSHTNLPLYVDLVPKTWYRLCVVRQPIPGGNNASFKVYVNGVVNMSMGTGVSVTIDSGAYLTMIGWREGPSDSFNQKVAKFRGKICDVQIWTEALDADDMTYDAANPENLAWERPGTSLSPGDLAHHYTFTDGSYGEFSSVHDQASGSRKGYGQIFDCKNAPSSDLFRGNIYGADLNHNGTIYNQGRFSSCSTFESLNINSTNFLRFDENDVPENAKNEGAIGSFHYKTDATNFRMQLTSPTAVHYQDTGYIISKPFTIDLAGNKKYLLTLDLKIISGDFHFYMYGDNNTGDWTDPIEASSSGRIYNSRMVYDCVGDKDSSGNYSGPILTEGSSNPGMFGGPDDGYVNGTWVRRSYEVWVPDIDNGVGTEICLAFTGVNNCEAKFTNIKLEDIGDNVALSTSEFSGPNLHSTGTTASSHWISTSTPSESRTNITPEYGTNFVKFMAGNRQANDSSDDDPGSPFWGKLPGTTTGGFASNLDSVGKHVIIEAFILPEGNGDLISNGTKVPLHTTEYGEPDKIGAISAIGSAYRDDISTTFERVGPIVPYYGNGLDTQFLGWDEVGDINSTVETANQLAGTRCPKLATDGSGNRSILCQTIGARIDSEQGLLIYRFWIQGDGSSSLEWALYHKDTFQGQNSTGPTFAEYNEVIPFTSFGYTTNTWKEVYLVFDKKNPVFNQYPSGANLGTTSGHRFMLAIKSPSGNNTYGRIDLMNMNRSATLKYESIDFNSTNHLTLNMNSENTSDEQLHRDPNCYDLNDYTENNGCVLTYHGTSTRIKADFVNSNSSFTTDPLAVNSGEPEAVYPGSRYCVWLQWRQEGDGSVGGGVGGAYKLGVTFNNPDGTSTRKVHQYNWVDASTYNEVNLFFDNDAYSENATITIDADGDPYTGTHLVNFKYIKVYLMHSYGISSINVYEPGSSFDFASGSNIRHVPQLSLQSFNASYKFSYYPAKNYFRVGSNGLTNRKLDTTMSISFWMRLSKITEKMVLLGGFFYNKSGDNKSFIRISPGTNSGYSIEAYAGGSDSVRTESNAANSTSAGPALSSKWVHVVINKNTDGGNWDDNYLPFSTTAPESSPFTIYINGLHVKHDTSSATSTTTEGTTVGAAFASSAASDYFNGELRDLATFDTKLTHQDIHDLREGAKPCGVAKYIEKNASHLWRNVNSIKNFVANSLKIKDTITNDPVYTLELVDPLANQDPALSLRNSNSVKDYDDGGFELEEYNPNNTSTYRIPPSSGYSTLSYPNLVFNRSPFHDSDAGDTMDSMGVDFWLKFSRTGLERKAETGDYATYAPIITNIKGSGAYAYLQNNFEVTLFQYDLAGDQYDYLMIRYWDDTYLDANAVRAFYRLQHLNNPRNHSADGIALQSSAGINPSRGIGIPYESNKWYHFHIGISQSIGPNNDNYLGFNLYQPIHLFINGCNVLQQGMNNIFTALSSNKEIGNKNSYSTIGRGIKSTYTGGDIVDTSSVLNTDVELSSLKVYNEYNKAIHYERANKNYRAERRKH